MQQLIFRRNIRLGNIICIQKFLQIAAVADQQNGAEFSGVDILEPGRPLPGADAGPDYRFQVFPVVCTSLHFPSEHWNPHSELDGFGFGGEG